LTAIQQSVLDAADMQPGQTERLYVPRILISAGIELNEALAEKRPLRFNTISSEDPRVVTHAWYVAGRVTPDPGTLLVLY
jgi:hypothetical protein